MKKGILFVGSFKSESESGHVGGQMFACNSLLKSAIRNDYNWYLVDSTAPSAISASFVNRCIKALKRIFLCIQLLLLQGKKIHTVLIFTVDGFSFIEKGIILLISKIFGKKTVIAPRSGLFPNNFTNPWFKRFIKYVFQKADWIICQGSSWKEFFMSELETLNSKKLIIINNWIDPELYRARLKEKSSSKIIITYIGWFERFKGIYDLVDVIELINKEAGLGEKVEFRLAGMGSHFEDVKSKMEGSENVKLLGWVKGQEKDQLFRETDIYIQLSHVEGFPNAILEAMASSKAVIASNAGAIKDLIQDGENGLIVDVRDTYQAFQKLSLLVEDKPLRLRIAKNAEATVRRDFVLDTALKKFKLILN